MIRDRKAVSGVELEAGEGGIIPYGGGRFDHALPANIRWSIWFP
jgi:hypothetical protein